MSYIIKKDTGRIDKYSGNPEGIKEVPNAKVYYLDKGTIPEYDTNCQTLKETYLYLDELYGDSTHVKICRIDYEVTNDSNDEIIQKLNDSLGVHLDTLYPEWKRSKHAGESLRFLLKGQANWTPEDMMRIQYITDFADWCKENRQIRDNREADLLINGVLPSFEWTAKPEGLR